MALSTLLFTTVISLGQSFIEANQKQTIQFSGTAADGSIYNLNSKQYKSLKRMKEIKNLGQQRTLAYISTESLKIKNNLSMLHWYSNNEWKYFKKPSITDFKGTYPKKINEIAASAYTLKVLGITKPKLGMEIPINFTIDDQHYNETFTLSAYYTDFLHKRVPDISYAIVSNAFDKKYRGDQDNTISSFKFENGIDRNLGNKRLKKTLQLSKDQLTSFSDGEDSQNIFSVFVGVTLFSLIILLSGGLLIYNVIYISIAEDIRFYGVLKAVGTTKKQLKELIFKQTLLLALIGIPIGLLTGMIISFLIIPIVLRETAYSNSIVVSNHPLIYVVSSVLPLIMIFFSTFKSAKFVAKVSPIQALHFTEVKQKKKVINSKNGSRLTFIAWRNVFREKKRAFVVILSLFLGLTSFVTVNSILKSIDFEKFLVEKMSYDIEIGLSEKEVTRKSRVDNNRSMNNIKKFLQSKKSISNYSEYYHEFVEVPYEPEKYSDYIDSYNDYFKYAQIDKEKISQNNFIGELIGLSPDEAERVVISGGRKFDKNAFKRGEIMLVQSDSPEDFRQIESIKLKIYEKLPFEINIGGFIKNNYMEIQTKNGPAFFISKDYLLKVSPEAELLSSSFNVKNEDEETVVKGLNNLLEKQSSYTMVTKEGMRERAKNETMLLSFLGNTLSIVLLVIGLLNFTNIIVTNILSRKREIATMESIGMTKKQINRMLILEGFYYSLIVTLMVGSLGTIITYYLFSIVKRTASYAIFTIPFLQIFLVIMAVFVICLVTPFLAIRGFRKKELADRIK